MPRQTSYVCVVPDCQWKKRGGAIDFSKHMHGNFHRGLQDYERYFQLHCETYPELEKRRESLNDKRSASAKSLLKAAREATTILETTQEPLQPPPPPPTPSPEPQPPAKLLDFDPPFSLDNSISDAEAAAVGIHILDPPKGAAKLLAEKEELDNDPELCSLHDALLATRPDGEYLNAVKTISMQRTLIDAPSVSYIGGDGVSASTPSKVQWVLPAQWHCWINSVLVAVIMHVVGCVFALGGGLRAVTPHAVGLLLQAAGLSAQIIHLDAATEFVWQVTTALLPTVSAEVFCPSSLSDLDEDLTPQKKKTKKSSKKTEEKTSKRNDKALAQLLQPRQAIMSMRRFCHRMGFLQSLVHDGRLMHRGPASAEPRFLICFALSMGGVYTYDIDTQYSPFCALYLLLIKSRPYTQWTDATWSAAFKCLGDWHEFDNGHHQWDFYFDTQGFGHGTHARLVLAALRAIRRVSTQEQATAFLELLAEQK